MAWTGNKVEELRHRIDEVDDLRDEEEQNCLAKVPKNSNNGEGHARKVVECVTNEDFGWISKMKRNKSKSILIQQHTNYNIEYLTY